MGLVSWIWILHCHAIWGKADFPYRFLSHEASHLASARATYLDSVEYNAIIIDFFNFQVIALPAARKIYPDVDFPILHL